MKLAAMAIWLAAELLKLPGSVAPSETREEFESRVHQIALAEVEEAARIRASEHVGWSTAELAAFGAVTWHGETLFDVRVHSGEGHPVWTQDHGKARCGMQLHKSGIVPSEVWEKLAGLEQTNLCAQYGLRVVVAQGRNCGVIYRTTPGMYQVAQVFSAYATGGSCTASDRDYRRASIWKRIMSTYPG
jgi:hypothetical protein